MNILLLNQVLSMHIVFLIIYYVPYFVVCFSFPLKISRKRAIIKGLYYSLFGCITSAFSVVFIGQGYIEETAAILLLNKCLAVLSEFILITFIARFVAALWYHIYWLIFFIVELSIALVGQYTYININTYHKGNYHMLKAISWNNVYQIILLSILLIILAFLLIKILKIIHKLISNHILPDFFWLLLNIIIVFLVITGNKSYTNHTAREINKSNIWKEGIGNIDYFSFAFFIIMLIMILLITYMQRQHLLTENRMLKEQSKLQMENYLIMEQQEIRIYRMHHDSGNHLRTIQLLVHNGEVKEAKKYMDMLLKEYNAINGTVYSKNSIINTVISDKVKQCNSLNIVTEVNINLSDDIFINELDLVSIFANLIEVAKKNCQNNCNENSFIKINANMEGFWLIVEVIYSRSSSKVAYSKLNKISKKSPLAVSGEMKTLSIIIERYKGSMEQKIEEKEISISIKLKKPNIVSVN